MAKAKSNSDVPSAPSTAERHKWDVEDALRTLTRAYEIVKDKGLMADVKKLASERAEEMEDIAGKMAGLAKMGLVSDGARAKAMDKGKWS